MPPVAVGEPRSRLSSSSQPLFSLSGELTTESLDLRKETVRDIYQRLSDRTPAEPVPLAQFRERQETEAFVLGEVVEKL